jgi:ketosteroid isomerase-like protein
VSDVEVVERVYRALADRDIDALFELFAPDCDIIQDQRLPWGGDFKGHDGFIEFATTLAGKIDSAVTTDAIFEAEGVVFQFGRTRGTVRATGKAFEIPEVHRWKIRDGRVAEAHFAIDTNAMLEALGDMSAS